MRSNRGLILCFFILTLSLFTFVTHTNRAQTGPFLEPVHVVVQEGDTLWAIAKEHNPGMDIRRYIYLIEKTNGLSSPIIFPGQVLVIPPR